MGKKKTKTLTVDSDDDLKSNSDMSGPPLGSIPDGDDGTSVEESFGELVSEHLSAKRSSSRLAALKQTKTWLVGRPDLAPVFASYAPTMFANLTKCIKQGKDEEEVVGTHLLAVSALFFGDESDDYLLDAANLSISVMKDKQAPIVVTVLAYDTLCCCLAANPHMELDDFDPVAYMRGIWGSSGPKTPELVAASLSAWAFMFTIPDYPHAPLDLLYAEGHRVLALAAHDNYDISCAALEALGLMYEKAFEESRRAPPGLGKQQLEELVAGMLTEMDRSISKQLRKDKKELARRILSTVSDQALPSERVTVSGTAVDLDGWTSLLHLDLLRGILESGLPSYMASSACVRVLLGISDVTLAPTRLSKKDKKAAVKDANERDKQKTIREHKKSSVAGRQKLGVYEE